MKNIILAVLAILLLIGSTSVFIVDENNKAIKIIPIERSKNTVVFDEIDIFFNEGVGILLTNNNAMKIVR